MPRLTIRMPTTLGLSSDALARSTDARSVPGAPVDGSRDPSRAFAAWVGCWAGVESGSNPPDAERDPT